MRQMRHLSEPGKKSGSRFYHPRRARKLSAKLKGSLVLETVSWRQIVDSECTFRQHIFIPVIESMIAELEARFSGH